MKKNTKINIVIITLILILVIIYEKGGVNSIITSNLNSKLQGYESKSYYGISSSNEIATNVGMEIIENGGNAVDAAVAMSYVLGVVEPYASGIGGGGGMLVYEPSEDSYRFFDYRETAPSYSKINNVGIPGMVKGMDHVHKIYGSMNIKDLIQPAINYAQEGFRLNDYTYNRFEFSKNKISNNKLSQFYKNGKTKSIGSRIVQKDLANTLIEIQKNGAESFYEGKISEEILQKTGWDKDELSNYTVIERDPIKSSFNGYDVVTAPPPFSGVTLSQILQLSEYENVPNYNANKIGYIESMSKIVNLAYNDRINTVADPMFISKDYSILTEDNYIKSLYSSNNFKVNDEIEHESTTHFVVIDKKGMIVSTTNTVSDFFGSGSYVSGFFLNNTLSQFNYTNKYSINKYEVGKRPRTFMCPTIISKDDDFKLGIGSPGGNRIPQVIAQVLIKYFNFDYSLEKATEEDRIEFSNNNKIISESKLSKKEIRDLQNMGYKVELNTSSLYHGSIQAIGYDKKNGMFGVADSRRSGKWKIDYTYNND